MRAVAGLAVMAGVLGAAPAAQAWGTNGYTVSSCWRPWLSSSARFGGDGGNYTPVPGGEIDFYIRVDAYLKHGAYTNNVDFVRGEATGFTSPRKWHDNVTGDGSWYVYAYGQDAPGHTSNQKVNSCTIT
jgi:hypothetical protein